MYACTCARTHTHTHILFHILYITAYPRRLDMVPSPLQQGLVYPFRMQSLAPTKASTLLPCSSALLLLPPGWGNSAIDLSREWKKTHKTKVGPEGTRLESLVTVIFLLFLITEPRGKCYRYSDNGVLSPSWVNWKKYGRICELQLSLSETSPSW